MSEGIFLAEIQSFREEFREFRLEVVKGFKLVQSDIAELGVEVGSLRADLELVKVDVRVLKNDVSELKIDVSQLKNDVSELKIDVSQLKIDVSELKTDMELVKSEVHLLKVGMAEFKAEFVAFRSEMRHKLSGISSFLLASEYYQEGLAGRLTKVERRLRKLEGGA